MKNLMISVLLCLCAMLVESCAVANMAKNFPSTIIDDGSARGDIVVQGVRLRPTFHITFRTLSNMKLCGGRLNVTYAPATIAPATEFLILTNQSSAISGDAPSGTERIRIVLDYAGTTNVWNVPLQDGERSDTTLIVQMYGGCE